MSLIDGHGNLGSLRSSRRVGKELFRNPRPPRGEALMINDEAMAAKTGSQDWGEDRESCLRDESESCCR